MLVIGTFVAAAGAGVGLFGGLLGVRLFNQLSDASLSDKQIASYGPWQRALVIGLLTSIVTMMVLSAGGREITEGLVGLACLGVSFVSAAVYILVSLTLFAKYGPAILEAGEISLAATIVLTAFLTVCGLLWITLVLLGGCVLLAGTVLNGIWIYRQR
ncbi:hypothetical protein FYK55_03585 [Roseiconus nitratireducens]|uniref:Uncharacterized protein n=1 Tax=Roseiconus nitratireducens TaxID=2605748 RepID=A0A5M6DIG5_9BACT|nr:hypothetical protein [Roseiconus nitratireducens]KAA5546002.1 hypothetical protein FYK55_03585 [Roseiconus nitratireducens]